MGEKAARNEQDGIFPLGGAEERSHIRRQDQRRGREGRHRSDQDRHTGEQREMSLCDGMVLLPVSFFLSSLQSDLRTVTLDVSHWTIISP